MSPRRALRFLLLPVALLPLAVSAGCVSVDERRQTTLERAETLLDRGDRAKALGVLDAFLAFDPRDQIVRRHMARIHLDAANPGQALAVLEALPGDVDRQTETHGIWTEALVAAGRYRQAATMLQRAEARGEPDPAARRDLLQALARCCSAGEVPMPEPWLEELVGLMIDGFRLDAAIVGLAEIQDPARRDELAERLFQAAMARPLESRDIKRFRTVEALHRAPDSPWKLLLRHRLMMQDGLEDEAARLEDRFLSLYQDHPRRFHMLLSAGRRSLRAGDADAGLTLAREAATLKPNRPEPLLDQALAFKALDRTGEAERALETALALQPDFRPARDLLARLDRRSGDADSSLRLRLDIDGKAGS